MSTLAACFKRGRSFTRIHYRCAPLLGSEGGDLGFNCCPIHTICDYWVCNTGTRLICNLVVFGNEPVKVWGQTRLQTGQEERHTSENHTEETSQ